MGAEPLAPYRFHNTPRPLRLAVVLGLVYAALIAAWALIAAAWWLMLLLALPTLPALWELIIPREAGLEIADGALSWYSGRRRAEVRLDEIDHIRMDTRWDFSVRVRVMLQHGKRLQLPHESLPPHRQLEAELTARGIKVVRHHFTTF